MECKTSIEGLQIAYVGPSLTIPNLNHKVCVLVVVEEWHQHALHEYHVAQLRECLQVRNQEMSKLLSLVFLIPTRTLSNKLYDEW
jgi:hypothetical protein